LGECFIILLIEVFRCEILPTDFFLRIGQNL
jgi:hypothetical protein